MDRNPEPKVATVQEQLRGANPHPRSVAVAGRSYPTSEVRDSGQEETLRVQGQGQRPRGASRHLKSVAPGRRHPESEVRGGLWEELLRNRGQWRPGRDTPRHSLLEKCKSKAQWGITLHQSEWLSSKSLQTINAGEGVEKRECACTVGKNVNWYSHCGRWYDSFKSRE